MAAALLEVVGKEVEETAVEATVAGTVAVERVEVARVVAAKEH